MNDQVKLSALATAFLAFNVTTQTAHAVNRPSYNTGSGFFVVNDQGGYSCSSVHPCKLYDANGNAFRLHGVNSLHYNDTSNDQIYLSGATAIRMWTPPTCYTSGIVQSRAIAHSIVPIISAGWFGGCPTYVTTGSTLTADLNSAVSDWVSGVSNFSGYAKYYILNIANEWGPGDTTDTGIGGHDTSGTIWLSAYESAITSLRNAGYLGPLMIDCGASGKSIGDILDQGQNLMNYDPQHNLIFSVHGYEWTARTATLSGQYPYTQSGWMSAVDATGLPYGMFEFGHNGDSFSSQTSIQQDIQNCENASNCLGWTGWGWDDDSATFGYLFPSNTSTFDGTVATLTTWGVQIVCSPSFGLSSIANCSPNADGSSTYTKASVFGGVTNNGLASLDLYKVISAFGISALGVLGYMLGGKKWARLSGLSKRLQPLWRTLTARIAYLRK